MMYNVKEDGWEIKNKTTTEKEGQSYINVTEKMP